MDAIDLVEARPVCDALVRGDAFFHEESHDCHRCERSGRPDPADACRAPAGGGPGVSLHRTERRGVPRQRAQGLRRRDLHEVGRHPARGPAHLGRSAHERGRRGRRRTRVLRRGGARRRHDIHARVLARARTLRVPRERPLLHRRPPRHAGQPGSRPDHGQAPRRRHERVARGRARAREIPAVGRLPRSRPPAACSERSASRAGSTWTRLGT